MFENKFINKKIKSLFFILKKGLLHFLYAYYYLREKSTAPSINL